jgi:hypothetical protein
MSALRDPQGLDSYEAACRFRESAADQARKPAPPAQPGNVPPHVPEQARSDEGDRPDRGRS